MAYSLGPTGPVGIQGPQGLQGLQGPAGKSYGITGPSCTSRLPLYIVTPTTNSFNLNYGNQTIYYNLGRYTVATANNITYNITVNVVQDAYFPVSEQNGMTWIFLTPTYYNSTGFTGCKIVLNFTGLFTGSYNVYGSYNSKLVMTVDGSGVASFVFTI
jgi:hypothetical protein